MVVKLIQATREPTGLKLTSAETFEKPSPGLADSVVRVLRFNESTKTLTGWRIFMQEI